jgi:hypothetical protein
MKHMFLLLTVVLLYKEICFNKWDKHMQGRAGRYINLPFLEVGSVSSLLERSFSVSDVSSIPLIAEDELVVVFGGGVDGVLSRVNK